MYPKTVQYFPVYNCSKDISIHCDIIYVLTILELILMLIIFLSYGLAIHTCIRSTFHYNLIFIGTFMLSGYYTYILGRTTVCFYEIGVLRYEDADGNSEAPYSLLLAAFFQYFYMGCACGISLSIGFERYVATYFVDSYETKKRKWVSLVICINFTVAYGISAYFMLFEIVPIYIMTILGMILSCVSFMFYLTLFAENQKWLYHLMQMDKNDKYTLSLRFQLNENMQVMTLLRNVVIYSGTNNFINSLVLVAKTLKYVRTNYPLLVLYLHLAFNILCIVYAYSIILILLLSVRVYRVYFFSMPIIRFVFWPIFGRCFEQDFNLTPVKKLSIIAETNTYFDSLTSQWDSKLDRYAKK